MNGMYKDAKKKTQIPGEKVPDGQASETLIAFLKKLSCFKDAEDSVLTPLLPYTELTQYHAGDTIIACGQDDGSLLYGVVEGQARLTKAMIPSGEIDVEDVAPGRTIGLARLFAGHMGGQEGISLVASTDLSLLYIEADGLMQLTRRRSTLMSLFLQHCARELVDQQAPGEETIGPERRLYRYILSLVERHGDQFSIRKMPRHASLGEATGTSDREAAAAVARLIADGVARRDFPALTLLDLGALRALAY